MFDAYEAINELIDDINVDYYESCYDAIYEELCDRVDYGELTIEEAEMINDAAAEKYLPEGNAFNRVLNDKINKRKTLDNRADALKDLSKTYDFTNSGPVRKPDLNQSYRINDKIRKNFSLRKKDQTEGQMTGYRHKFDPESYVQTQNDIKQGQIPKSGYGTIKNMKLKQDWMNAHGNKGLRPEEKYKAGRYLKAQQEINSKK